MHAETRSSRPPRSRRSLAALLALVALAVGIATVEPVDARTDDKAKPVLFVHGYNPTSTSTNCGADFDRMISQLRSEGFTGPMIKVGYYSGDYNCNVNLRSYGSYGDRDSWRQIAKAFSHYVHREFTSKGIAVDVVGYSMGGLITRGAVHGTQRGETGFSARIDVEDVVTLGTPHEGAAWYSNLCLWGQCAAMKPGSSDLNWLNLNRNPQGLAGTEWTNLGSNGDWVVSASSATSMSLPSTNKVVYSNVPHTGSGNYMGNVTVTTRTGNGLAYVSR